MAPSHQRTAFCKRCERPFSITHLRGVGGQSDTEDITCPHCRTVWGQEESTGVFQTSPLTPEEESKWLTQHGKAYG